MMIKLQMAIAIMKEVRSFYASGNKSGNKVYVNAEPDGGAVDLNDPFEAKWQEWNTTMLAVKASKRNQGALASVANRPQLTANEKYYEFGKRIYNGGSRSGFDSGNCMEMACVAGMIAVDGANCQRSTVYMGEIHPAGDHAFCIVSDKKPQWAMASEMVRGSSGASPAIVIDPWLNTTCFADEYWAAAKLKVQKWSMVGKRIAWSGPDGNAPGWYDPLGPYSEAFGSSPLKFVPM
jgi:hypothetical protein